ncbi:MAG: N-6 DNA methylase [Gammaproteobacteria bacterium]|nr:N-6 DNA methylase [Gammaproteobacteria bacterium]
MPNIIVIPEGKICDYIDGKFRNDTPEEYVRQNIEKRLVNEHKYAVERIAVEFGIRIGSSKRRADIVIFSAGAARSQENIQLIIECKKETVGPGDRKDGVGQLKSYMSSCANCEWGMWTNGRHKEVLRKVFGDTGAVEFAEFNDIPSADGRVEDIDRPQRQTLKNAVEDNLLFVFKACHNHIYVTDGMQKQPAFFELLKVIFCKIEDEKNIGKPLEFYATSGERSNPDGQLTVKNRIAAIFEGVKKKHAHIFEKNDAIDLHARSLAHVVSEIQKYSLLDTNIDIKGKAYEELVGANLRGDRGEFFTPRNVMRMTVQMLAPTFDDKVTDPACGTGGFLVVAMNQVIDQVQSLYEEENGVKKQHWSVAQNRNFQNRIADIAQTNFFGFDINPDLAKATKMNMVMNNDGSGNIFRTNSLLPPHAWDAEFRENLTRSLDIPASALRNSDCLGLFDVVVTNPPFGSRIPISESGILEQYELGHIWRNQDGHWTKSDRLRSSAPPEQLFIERCLQLLKPGGRMGIVLPDSILGAPGLGFIRQWLTEKMRIIASIDLHVDTFQPRNGTQTSVLILQKKTAEQIRREEKTRNMADYPIFMTMVDHIGHDKRGNPQFKRDADGSEILRPVVGEIAPGGASDLAGAVTVESREKISDDQTGDVVDSFKRWREKEGLSW